MGITTILFRKRKDEDARLETLLNVTREIVLLDKNTLFFKKNAKRDWWLLH